MTWLAAFLLCITVAGLGFVLLALVASVIVRRRPEPDEACGTQRPDEAAARHRHGSTISSRSLR